MFQLTYISTVENSLLNWNGRKKPTKPKTFSQPSLKVQPTVKVFSSDVVEDLSPVSTTRVDGPS